ncbi:5-methylcytosine-specific restriction endonuclease system specificity protein McrC [Paenibacillus sp. strain BS8-2]
MINIRNVYYMLAYAFESLREDGYAKLASETFEHTADLFAAILVHGISIQVKRGLGRHYIEHTEALSTPAGKIHVTATMKEQTWLKKQLICERDQFSENILLNQILKSTAMLLMKSSEVAVKYKKSLKKLMIYFTGVDSIDPLRIQWGSIRYHRHNAAYRMLIHICFLTVKGLLMKQDGSSGKLAQYVDDQHMHRLYEKFVREFYRKHYSQFRVSAAHIHWMIDDGFGDFLPAMKSDITIEYQGKTLIIDTKYYGRMMQVNTQYDTRTIHSNNMYQMFAYVKNRDVQRTGKVSGLLLYAKTNEEIVPDYVYSLGGNSIHVRTLDLNQDFDGIKTQLHRIVERVLQ